MSITSEWLTLEAVNASRTGYGRIKFSKSFFHTFEVDLEEESTIEGYDEDAYHVLLKSKHLLTLFRNPDSWEYVCLRTNMSTTAQPAARFKLLVEIKTSNLIVKKYQTSYNPTVATHVDVGKVYNSDLEKRRKNSQGMFIIHCLVMELKTLKSFLDTTASGAEDFRLNVKPDKIQITAYIKHITRDKEYLKQPMSVSLDIPLTELVQTNLLDYNLMVNFLFRLKELKTFSHLINSLNTLDADYDDSLFKILFRNPGEPILFQATHKESIWVQFVYLTTFDKESDLEAKELGYLPTSAPLSPLLCDLQPFTLASSRSLNEVLHLTTNKPKSNATFNGLKRTHKIQKTSDHRMCVGGGGGGLFSHSNEMENESDVDRITHERQTTPDWGGGYESIPSTESNLNIPPPSSMDHEVNLHSEEEYGPTQNTKRPKSIFD
ncbi:uncharacterized protein KQ657_003614 [Scheffersomyces spartinae]|uniref:Uncharacterized protein n=1 Tax=Scheffersomyces spartinae TaxID=45513 RepID=A0A9P7V525_9ASCO|nr:uncharacterized protein KQ657_003614 [Scheffersomyces spartinae]KAG7191276.1 hypothetical protein KQ657_003614 [Scheffersomyces spartinae]